MIHFPFETNRKLMVLGVPILKHFRVRHTDVDATFNVTSTQYDVEWTSCVR